MNKSGGWQGSTLSRHVKPSPASSASPYLFLVFQCDLPHALGARLCLDEVEFVEIGRSPDASDPRVDQLGGGRLALRLPDSWVSSSHAVLHRVLGSWVIEDAKSKNGTLVNGQLTKRAELADCDLIELGHSFLSFRAALPGPGGHPGSRWPRNLGTGHCLAVAPRVRSGCRGLRWWPSPATFTRPQC